MQFIFYLHEADEQNADSSWDQGPVSTGEDLGGLCDPGPGSSGHKVQMAQSQAVGARSKPGSKVKGKAKCHRFEQAAVVGHRAEVDIFEFRRGNRPQEASDPRRHPAPKHVLLTQNVCVGGLGCSFVSKPLRGPCVSRKQPQLEAFQPSIKLETPGRTGERVDWRHTAAPDN